MNKIQKSWEVRSSKYKDKIEGVLPKSFPKEVNKYLDNWMYSQVKSQMSKNKRQKVLDLGCGYGRLSKQILKEFPKAEVSGVDISRNYVNLYNKSLSPRGKAVVGDIRKLPFKDSSFDCVFMVTTLMYLVKQSDQSTAMKEIFRVLKPNGKFVFIERNPIGYSLITLGGLIEKIRGKRNKEIDSVSFSNKYMTDLVSKNGGALIERKAIPFGTLSLPIMFLLNSISLSVVKLIIRLVSYLDTKFSFLLTMSMYISYSGAKKLP